MATWLRALFAAGGTILALAAFKRIGREQEYESQEAKESRKNPGHFPPIGSVVYRDLSAVEHSGVYAGRRYVILGKPLFVSKGKKRGGGSTVS